MGLDARTRMKMSEGRLRIEPVARSGLETGGVGLVARFRDRDVGYLVTSRERSPWPARLVSSAVAKPFQSIFLYTMKPDRSATLS
jgi:hypothetical protein